MSYIVGILAIVWSIIAIVTFSTLMMGIVSGIMSVVKEKKERLNRDEDLDSFRKKDPRTIERE